MEGGEPAGQPLLGFLFGNVDEHNRVEADYLDEDAKENLGGLATVQGGALNLQELQADEAPAAAGAVAAEDGAPVQPAADAQDFADERELIDDAEQAAAAAAAAQQQQQQQLGLVTAALQAGVAAEEEDYDFDVEDEGQQPPQQQAQPPAAAAAVAPALPPLAAAPLQPALPSAAPPAVAPPPCQQQAPLVAQQPRVRLPVLGRSIDGETVLRFSELYGHQGVMAGHVSSADDLRPPPLLPRRKRHQQAAQWQQQQQQQQAVEAEEGDEEAMLLAANLEVPAEEADGALDLAAASGHAAPADAAAQQADLRAASGAGDGAAAQQPEQGQQQADVQPEAAAGAAAAVAGAAQQSLDAFLPVVTLPWEDRIIWDAKAGQQQIEEVEEEEDEPAGAGAEAAAGAAVASTDQGLNQDPGFASLPADATMQAWPEQQQGDAAQQQPPLMAHADIAAMFQQQDPQAMLLQQQQQGDAQLAVASMQLQQGAAAAAFPDALAAPAASAPAWPGGSVFGEVQPHYWEAGGSDQIASVAAARGEDSDADESWALPTAPLLRLEQLQLTDGDEEQLLRRLPPAPDMLPVTRERWEDRIAWQGASEARKLRMRGPALDLNDSSLVLELTKPLQQLAGAGRQQRAGVDVPALIERAAALVIEPQALALRPPPRGSGFDAEQPEEVELWQLQQGLAREREYYQQPRRKAGTGVTARVLHAKLAADLATLPILNPSPMMQDEILALALWHTPRGKWWPLEISRVSLGVGGSKKKGAAGGPVTINIASLPGVSKVFQSADLNSQLQDLWHHLVANIPQFKAAEGQQPVFLLPGRPPAVLPLDRPLLATGAVKQGQKQVNLTIAFQDIELLPSAAMNAIPENDNPALLRPPNAFARKRDFSAAEPGHVLLLEYMEQQPPLLNRPGMGAKLVTYYRKKDAKDSEHQKLKQEVPRWRVGTVQALGDDDDSPFLGQLARGGHSLSVESGLFRSLAFPYAPPHTDFLLLRTPAGTMQLRELSGTVVVGQELPMLRVPAPNAREVKDLEERRIYVHVFKHLRRQQAKLDKDPAKQGQKASITLKALAETFPSRPPAMIRAFLKDACDLAVQPLRETEVFSLKEGARPPSEAELRKKLTPEEACALEACYVAAFRMKQRGLVLHEKLDKAAIEKLRLAAEMLPPDDSYQKAARLVEQALLSAPWTLTDAFVTHFREGKAQLQLAGAADPTGRGFGYSFVRDVRHKHAGSDDVTKQMAKKQAGKVQGTDADLRRMTTAQARERLRGYGLTEEEIQGLGRWTMIDMVRQLASAAAQDGTVDAAAIKFVRHQKTTMIELQRRAAEKAQQILEKQMAVLNDSAAEDLGDQDELEAELERELAAADEAAEAELAAPQSKKKGKRETTPTPDDEQRMLQQMRAEGLMATPAANGGAAPAAGAGVATPPPAGAGGPPPKDGPGTKRIRREVFLKASDGSWQKSHEIIYVGRDRPGQLHSLYQKEGSGSYPFGFGTRTVAGRPKELRLSYAAARGRGIGRGPSRGGGPGRGRGRGRGGKGAAAELGSPEGALAARQSKRQRKQRQTWDEILESDELLSDDGDLEYNEEAEAPYFAAAAAAGEEEPQAPKPARGKKKKKAADGEAGGEAAAAQQQQLEQAAFPALPDDFAAALAAATRVVLPPAPEPPPPAEPAAAAAAEPPSGDGGGGAGPSQQQEQEQELPPLEQEVAPQPEMAVPAGPPPPQAKPKLKIKLGGVAAAPAKQPQREPSPEYVYDFTVAEEEEEEEEQQPGRRSAKSQDADYEVQHDADDASDDFVPGEDDVISEEERERRHMRKLQSSRSNGGRASRAQKGGGGARRRAAGGGGSRGGAKGRAKPGGGGGSKPGGKRRRSEFEEELEDEFESEEDVELSDEEPEMFDDEGGTSDEGGTPQPRRQRSAAGGATGTAVGGQLGTVGRQLGAILSAVVQQLRNIKLPFGFPAKLTKVYDVVFGKVPGAKHVPDYHDYVPKSRVMILPEIQKKAKAGRYLSLEQFRADLQQVYSNAVTYNTPGSGGQYGDPYFIELAAKLLEDAEGLITQNITEIQAAEEALGYQAAYAAFQHQPPP